MTAIEKEVVNAEKLVILWFDQETQGVTALTPEIISVLSLFSSVFTRPTWKKVQTLLIGAILCRRARRGRKFTAKGMYRDAVRSSHTTLHAFAYGVVFNLNVDCSQNE